MALNERGHEVLDPSPTASTVPFRRPPTLQQTIKDLIRNELSFRAEAEGQETFEEADDFDVGDDYDPYSPYELTFDPGEPPSDPGTPPLAPAASGAPMGSGTSPQGIPGGASGSPPHVGSETLPSVATEQQPKGAT